jgi:hypothetical protein
MQIRFSEFDPARLFRYVLSRLVEPHAAEADTSKSALAKRRPPPEARIPPRLAVVLKKILKTTQRRWPSRYY